ncbi:hypothetical protein [Candidatus Venteria ishoeyi]|uniref:Uncharacterized protein n=1 Tax=Candidatus Venteria ishoeyi TaxID=1899563 RepID=A0A1H6F4H2_9GAMM|nr:hypothetical protein [Candidatus Venteria ishoeyi]SEH04463.1 Uncharacterised protein [Candidatus Venteria ishoeyi]
MQQNMLTLFGIFLISLTQFAILGESAFAAEKSSGERADKAEFKKPNCMAMEWKDILPCVAQKLSLSQKPDGNGDRAGNGKLPLKTWMAVIGQKTDDSATYCYPQPHPVFICVCGVQTTVKRRHCMLWLRTT